MQNVFKISDTIKIVSRLFDDNDVPFDISSFNVRSVLKNGPFEITGVIQRPDNFTVISIFNTSSATRGKYQTDIRFSNLSESFSTPIIVVELVDRVS